MSVTFAGDPAERGRAFAVFGAVSGMGGAIGLTLGGFLIDALSWRWCLFINVPIAAAALIGALVFVRDREPRHVHRGLDLPGSVLITAGLFGVVYGLGNSAIHGWSTVTTWLPLAAGIVLIVGFVVRERRVARPLLPLSVVLDRNRGAAYLGIGISGVGSFAIFLYLSYFLQQTLGYSALHSGLAFLPFAAVLIAGAGISGSVLLPRTGPRPLVPAGCLFAAGSLLLLTRIDQNSSYLTGVLPSVLLFGFGVGLLFGCAQNVATSGVDADDSGVASAMVNTMQQVGGSLGLALFTSISASAIDRYLADHPGQSRDRLQTLAALSSYHTVFWVAAGVFVAGAALTAAIFRPGPVAPARVNRTGPPEALLAGAAAADRCAAPPTASVLGIPRQRARKVSVKPGSTSPWSPGTVSRMTSMYSRTGMLRLVSRPSTCTKFVPVCLDEPSATACCCPRCRLGGDHH